MVLSERKVKTVGIPPSSLHFLCLCIYLEKCVRWMNTTVICGYEPRRSAVAKHNINVGSRLRLNTSILAKKSRCRDRFKRKMIEVCLDPNNVNREDGFCVRMSGKPLIAEGIRTFSGRTGYFCTQRTTISFCTLVNRIYHLLFSFPVC